MELADRITDFEVAMDILGQSMQPALRALNEERAKEKPCQAYIDFCKARMSAVHNLRENLTLDDTEIIKRILDRNDWTAH